MSLDEKGFASAEFIFVTLIVLVLFGGLASLVNTEMQQTQTGSVAQARITGEKIAETVNAVYINGMGYSINSTVPDDMIVYVNNPAGYVTIYSITTNKNISIKLIPKNVQTITLSNGTVFNVTYNNNGNITFNQ